MKPLPPSAALSLATVLALASQAAHAQSLTWDANLGTSGVQDGAGTWDTTNPNWWDGATNVPWDPAKTAVIGNAGAGGTITVTGTIQLAGLTFGEVTSPYTLGGGSLTAPGGTLTLTNNDTGNDRRMASGASIGAKLTGSMNVVFAGVGDNVALTHTANDFIGEIRLSGGGLSIGSDAALGNAANDIAVKAAGGTLRNTAAITVNRDVTFDAGTNLSLVNSGNVLTLSGNISGGDSATVLTIGAGHGNSHNHNVRLTGTNTMAGTIRIFNVLRAYEGAGLSPNANIVMGDYFDFSGGYANTCGFLETSGNFTRALGTAAGQFQWAASGNYKSGGFSAVGDTLAINFGGAATPATLTWNTTTGFIKTAGDLRLQNASATHDLVWKNPVNLNGAARVIYSNSTSHPAIMEGVLSGTGSSGITKEGVGTLTLTATNTYAGATTISGGTLQIGNGGTTGRLTATSAIINNANLTINRSDAFSQATDLGAGVAITGSGSFTQAGTGTTTLTANSSYAGTTSVNAGSLIVNGTHSGAGAVTVASGAKLGGSGVLAASTTISGILAPGNSIGTLTVGNDVTWQGTASAGSSTDWQYELGLSNSSDLLNITGTSSEFLKDTAPGSFFRFDFLGSTATGTFTLVDWESTANLAGGALGTNFLLTDFSYTNLGGGNTGTFGFNGTSLEFTVVPEPRAALIGGLGLLMLFRRKRSSLS